MRSSRKRPRKSSRTKLGPDHSLSRAASATSRASFSEARPAEAACCCAIWALGVEADGNLRTEIHVASRGPRLTVRRITASGHPAFPDNDEHRSDQGDDGEREPLDGVAEMGTFVECRHLAANGVRR